jgi:uncharacterized membrane protein YdcZ (DUF606 family)
VHGDSPNPLCAAVMSVTVAILSLVIERLWIVLPGSPYFDSIQSLASTTMLMLFGGTIAFFMVWTEFTVIAETSALTFMVAGTFKEIVTGMNLRYVKKTLLMKCCVPPVQFLGQGIDL